MEHLHLSSHLGDGYNGDDDHDGGDQDVGDDNDADLGSQFLPCLIFFLSRNINAALIHRVIAKDDGLGEMLLLVAKMNKIKARELLRISVGSSL